MDNIGRRESKMYHIYCGYSLYAIVVGLQLLVRKRQSYAVSGYVQKKVKREEHRIAV